MLYLMENYIPDLTPFNFPKRERNLHLQQHICTYNAINMFRALPQLFESQYKSAAKQKLVTIMMFVLYRSVKHAPDL